MPLDRRITRLAATVVVLACCAACSRPSAPEPPESPPGYTPGLGEIMTLNQMRHSKLWFAGQARNWDLASFELDELQEGFDDAATYHPTHEGSPLPIPDLIEKIVTEPMRRLADAVEAHDLAGFTAAFDALTAGCNSCHQATNFGFNVVTRPSSNPFTNQSFGPR